jgi:hypothetical protein
METKINTNGLAILNTLKENKGKILAFAEIANLAGIDAKTGYLTSAKKLAKAENLAIVKRENAITATVTTITSYPSGYTPEKKTKEVLMDGYELIDAE